MIKRKRERKTYEVLLEKHPDGYSFLPSPYTAGEICCSSLFSHGYILVFSKARAEHDDRWEILPSHQNEYVYQKVVATLDALRAVRILEADPGPHNVLYHQDDTDPSMSILDFESIHIYGGQTFSTQSQMMAIFGPEFMFQFTLVFDTSSLRHMRHTTPSFPRKIHMQSAEVKPKTFNHPGMYKFIPDKVGGVGSKRKASHKTCESCKKRHKRCLHDQTSRINDQIRSPEAATPDFAEIAQSSEQDIDSQVTNDANNCASVPETQRPPKTGTSHAFVGQTEPLSETIQSRFVGNLSPEAYFFATGNQATDSDDRRTKVGVWLVARQPASEGHQSFPTDIGQYFEQNSPILFPLSSQLDLQDIFPSPQKDWMSVLPPKHEYDLMSSIYFAKFDPIFPIIQGENIEMLNDVHALALKQCICLVASLDPTMRPHLRLACTDGIMSQLEFRSRMIDTLKSILHADSIHDKMVLLQITALLAFFVDKPNSSEISSYYCAQAVEICQTLGLHVSYPNETEDLEKSHRIFWCIWALDRLNAATNGRPTVIHDRDTGEQVLNFVPEHLPCFRLFLRICKFLDAVISQYRPRPVLQTDLGLSAVPDYESIVCEATAMDIDSSLITSMEIFYLAVQILACRPQSHLNGPNRRPSSDAQMCAAANILSIASGASENSISYWAVLPYAISLAASVEYQTLRNSRIPYIRKRAYRSFHQNRVILDELSDTFVSARVMAQLAQDTINEARKPRVPLSRGRDINSHRTQHNDSTAGNHITSHSPNPRINSSSFGGQALPPGHLHGLYPASDDEWAAFDNIRTSEINGDLNEFSESFDFTRMDTLFSTNLNPTMPLIPGDWMNV